MEVAAMATAGGNRALMWAGYRRCLNVGNAARLLCHSVEATCESITFGVLEDAAALQPDLPKVVLKKGKAHIFRDGSPMVYSGAIDCVLGRPPPKTGDSVLVTDGSRNPIAWGVYNSVSMFRVRIMQTQTDAERDPAAVLDIERCIASRISEAANLRSSLGFPSAATTAFRLINSEGDRLSGLIVDVFGNHIVVASSAAWVEKYRSAIEQALVKATGKTCISWRPSRELLKEEGMDLKEADTPSREAGELIHVFEHGITYQVSLQGQKTGFYVDQRDNRLLVQSLSNGKAVLDLCCYTGGFAINAMVGGATYVTGVDSSSPALQLADINARLNNINHERIKFHKSDITEFMRSAIAEKKLWDIVILDPPKLAPKLKVLGRAAVRYRSLNSLALQLTKPGGLLMTCSCSGAMTQSGTFPSVVQEAARLAGRNITLLRHGGAGTDHTLNFGYPEGNYLTNLLVHVG